MAKSSKQIAAQIEVWGCDQLAEIILTPRNWSRVKNGKELNIRGKGIYIDGEKYWDYWSFNSQNKESLVIFYEGMGGFFEGMLSQAETIKEFEYKPRSRKRKI